MNKLPVDILIEGLKEWNEKRNYNNAQDYLTLLMIINADLGVSLSKVFDEKANINTELEVLRKRVCELCETEHINQIMLIEGIVSKITRFFSNGYKGLVENLCVMEKFEEKKENAPKIFEKFKTLEYRQGVELDEQVWNEIISSKLSKYDFNMMDNQKFLKEYENQKDKFLNI